jgi:DNA-binding GntR family transcriptional regulator
MNTYHGNLTEHAYLLIRDRILRGELPFGTGLSRRALAEDFGISIVPVGDALQRLENDGLVESRPRVGTRVRIPTPKAIRGHYILREALESQAARIFAEKASPNEREEIKQLASQLDEHYTLLATTEGATEPAFQSHTLHMRFHMRIAECTGCDELCQAVEKNQVLVFNWLYDTSLGNQQQPPPGWHRELAEALVSEIPKPRTRPCAATHGFAWKRFCSGWSRTSASPRRVWAFSQNGRGGARRPRLPRLASLASLWPRPWNPPNDACAGSS